MPIIEGNNLITDPDLQKYFIDQATSLPIFGVTGPIRAGKNSVSKILCNNSKYLPLTSSDILRRKLLGEGKNPPFTREQVAKVAQELQIQFGKDVMARLELAIIGQAVTKSPITGVVLDGYRYLQEALFFRQFPNITLIWVDAPRGIRFLRTLRAQQPGDLITAREFLLRDRLECDWMRRIAELSHYNISNSGTLEELKKHVLKIRPKS